MVSPINPAHAHVGVITVHLVDEAIVSVEFLIFWDGLHSPILTALGSSPSQSKNVPLIMVTGL